MPREAGSGDLHRRIADLTEAVRVQQAQIHGLQHELFETNQGVLALYAELDDRAEQLRQLSDLKSRFLSYVSHEFRAPLAAIRSITALLLEGVDGPLTAEQRRQVHFVRTSAQELTEMVDDQLDLARVEAGRISIAPEWFELVDLFAALRGMFRPIVMHGDVTLTFDEPVGVPRLYTDHKKLAQILRNFIANGLKFTARGGVTVSARPLGEERIEFTVADTGIGIPPEALPTLLQDFSQVDLPIQRRLRGAGLGLALSRRFAELLGGTVGVESRVGVGSRFTLDIPVRLPGAGTAAQAPQP